MMKAVKGILAKFLLVGCSLLFALALIEFCVRAIGLYKFPAHDFVQAHPDLGWSHIPNKEGYYVVGQDRVHVKINSKGLRDKEYPYEKEKGTFRILVLGDSFTEALQVPLDNIFCNVLERELNKTQRHFEVINGGFGGVGTDYELLFLKREGYKYCPDLVILAFFGNDVYDNYRSHAILDNKNAPLEYEKKGLVTRLKRFLAQNSCAYNYFGYTLPTHLPFLAKVLMKLGLLSFQPIDDVQGVDQSHYLVFGKKYGREWEKAWDVTEVLISELKKETQKHGTNLAVISIPFREQVYERLWKSKLSKPGMGEMQWDLNKPDRLLSACLNDAGVPFLQLLPHFRTAAKTSQLHHGEGHWNSSGHRLAGELIHNWLVAEKLVPVEAVKPQSSRLKVEGPPTVFREGPPVK